MEIEEILEKNSPEEDMEHELALARLRLLKKIRKEHIDDELRLIVPRCPPGSDAPSLRS